MLWTARNLLMGETVTTPITAIEFVGTVHDGKSYFFSYLAGRQFR
jgi:hypothetical protein